MGTSMAAFSSKHKMSKKENNYLQIYGNFEGAIDENEADVGVAKREHTRVSSIAVGRPYPERNIRFA